LREFDLLYLKSNSRKNHSALGVEDAFGGARALGGAEGERLTYTTTSRWDQEWLHGPCVSGTSFDFDRPRRIGPTHCDGRYNRSRLTRTQA
jgi:hypothetical protein